MAFKAALGLMMLIFMFENHVHGDEMEQKGTTEDHGMADDYEESDMVDGRRAMRRTMGTRRMKKEMKDGKPMICYSKGKSTKKTDDATSKKLLNQAARLLGVVMQQTDGDDDVNAMTLRQLSGLLQKMITQNNSTHEIEETQEDEENTELGLELLELVKNLSEEFSIDELTATEQDDERMEGEHSLPPPMNDEPATPSLPVTEGGETPGFGLGGGIPVFGGSSGFSLTALGLSIQDILDLLVDPSMGFMIQSLGLGPLTEALQNEEVSNVLLQLDTATLDKLLQSGQLFNAAGGVNMEAILKIIQNMQGPPKEMPKSEDMDEGYEDGDMNMPKNSVTKEHQSGGTMKEGDVDEGGEPKTERGRKTMKELREGNENMIMIAFDRIMMMSGVEGEVNEDNIFEATSSALRYIASADDESLDELMQVVQQVSGNETNPDSTGAGGNDTEMMAVFERLLAVAGVGEVNSSNLVESIMTAMRFVVNADNDTLKMLMDILGNLNMMKSTQKGGEMSEDGYKESNMTKTEMSKEKPKKTKHATGKGKPRKTMKEMREEDESVMAVFDRILAIAGIEDEVTEENILQSTLKAMKYIMDADEETLRMFMDALGDVDLDILEQFGKDVMEDDEDMEYEKHEMVCYPMDEEDMEEYMAMKGKKSTMSVGTQTMGTQTATESSTGCNPCTQNTDEMKSMIQEMIHAEIGKVFSDLVVGMSNVRSVAPEVKTMLEKMANGGLYPGGERMGTLEDKYTEWSAWAACSASCGSGVKIRTRTCTEAYRSNNDADIEFCEEAEEIPCNIMECAMTDDGDENDIEVDNNQPHDGSRSLVLDKWGPWTDWDPCTLSCGGGVTVRSRTCKMEYMQSGGNDLDCEQSESKTCNIWPCVKEPATIEQWLEWEDWTPCSASCGSGVVTRHRQCVKKSNAASCKQVQSQSCTQEPCPTVSELSFWQDWSDWSSCSATCGEGVEMRRRECNVPTASECEGIETRSCQAEPCTTVAPPQLPFWKQWSEWSRCTATCGQGFEFRRRVCNVATASNCVENDKRPCQIKPCTTAAPPSVTTAAVGVWGRWSDWSVCTRTCGGGSRSRNRNCITGLCIGQMQESEVCNLQRCDTSVVRPKPRPTGVTSQPSRVPVATGRCPPSQYRQLRYKAPTSQVETCMVFHGRESGKKSFSDYRSYCQQRGGDIVRLHDVNKWVQVTYWMKNILQSYSDKRGMAWIGATDAGHRGMWSHPATPTQKSFLIWSRGQPKDASYDQCASLNSENGHSFANACTSDNYAICEYQP